MTTARISCADLEKWPDDGRRYELYDGEVWEVPSPILLHQFVADPERVRIEVFELIGERFKRASLATASEAVRSPLLPGVVVRPADLLPVLP